MPWTKPFKNIYVLFKTPPREMTWIWEIKLWSSRHLPRGFLKISFRRNLPREMARAWNYGNRSISKNVNRVRLRFRENRHPVDTSKPFSIRSFSLCLRLWGMVWAVFAPKYINWVRGRRPIVREWAGVCFQKNIANKSTQMVCCDVLVGFVAECRPTRIS